MVEFGGHQLVRGLRGRKERDVQEIVRLCGDAVVGLWQREWPGGGGVFSSPHSEHGYDGWCAICRGDISAIKLALTHRMLALLDAGTPTISIWDASPEMLQPGTVLEVYRDGEPTGQRMVLGERTPAKQPEPVKFEVRVAPYTVVDDQEAQP